MDTLNRNVTFLSASVSLLSPIVDPTGNTLIIPPCTLLYDSGYEQDAQGKICGSHKVVMKPEVSLGVILVVSIILKDHSACIF